MNFLKLQLLIVYRLMKGLGIIVSVLLLCVAGLLLYILSLAPQTNIILVDAALVAGFHYSRGDRELLAYADKAFYKPFRNKKRNAGNRYEA